MWSDPKISMGKGCVGGHGQLYLQTSVGMVLEEWYENRNQIIVNQEDYTSNQTVELDYPSWVVSFEDEFARVEIFDLHYYCKAWIK